MPGLNQRKYEIFFWRVLFAFWIMLCLTEQAIAERLPLRFYTSADGMASSVVTNIFRDSSGFLWFSTREGLARFDGREFVNYRLPGNDSRGVSFVLETRGGVHWIVSDGLYRIVRRDLTEVRAETGEAETDDDRLRLNAEKVGNATPQVMFEDRAGQIWGGSGSGLYIIEEVEGKIAARSIELPAAAASERGHSSVTSITQSADGSLWIGCQTGVVRRLPDRRMLFYPIDRASDYDSVLSLAADRDGRIYVGHYTGLFVFQPESLESLQNAEHFDLRKLPVTRRTVEASGEIVLPKQSGAMLHLVLRRAGNLENDSQYTQVSRVYAASDGKIWTTTNGVLYVFESDSVRVLDDERGLPIHFLSLTEDASGNLWFGSSSGAIRLAKQGFVNFGRGDGLFPLNIQSLHETADGRLFAVFGDWRVAEMTAGGLKTMRLKMPDSARAIWGSTAAMPGDAGGWWALAENGLYRFAALDAPPQRIYGARDGLKSDSLFCSFRDKTGNLWFSTRRTAEEAGLSRFDRQSETFQTFTTNENYPEGKSAMSFAEDSAGNLWLGFYQGGLARFAKGRFQIFTEAENAPTGMLMRLHVDRAGRLWIASNRDGLVVVENPTAEKPSFRKFTVADGLASNNINAVGEDHFGNIYAGTVRGIDRLAPDAGRVKHFSTADGLAADLVHLALRDKSGAMWFGTPYGLSRFEPQPEAAPPAPQILIAGLQIAGQRYAISEFGQSRIENIRVSASENNLQINFLSVGDAENLRYQHRLEGADADWSAPSFERNVNFANLAPGSYKFLVRAISNDGAASANPAAVSFTIRPPFWRTWQFIAAVVLLVGAGVFALDRYRVAKTRQVQAALEALKKSKEERLIELERVRTRIATDLHDDIGSSLTQIAVLTEVARSQAKNQANGLDAPLATVSGVATELMATMGDIVWAINPRKDNLRDLVQRMRRFAADVFTARNIKFEFDAPDVEINAQLGANLRREVYVIFKEAVNNVARHSEATRAEISLMVFADALALKVSDNGCGFDVTEKLGEKFSPDAGGNGLVNLQRRGAELGGRCEIISFVGGGTTVFLEIPLHADNITTHSGGENGSGHKLS